MSGPTVNQYKDLGATICGAPVRGLSAVSYSYKRTINNLFAPGNRDPISYASMPEIEVSITGYAGGGIGQFEVDQANKFGTVSITSRNGAAAASYALLSGVSYNFTVDEPFTITKTFTGFAKPQASGGNIGGNSNLYIIKRQDYTGGLPQGITGNHLKGVRAELSIQREYIGQFATRKPYASVVTFPISRSITYEVYTDAMDTIVVEDLQQACSNPNSMKYSVGIGACGVSFSISSAHVTSIEYSGGDAGSQDFQTMSITYTSYEDITGLKPVIFFDEESSC